MKSLKIISLVFLSLLYSCSSSNDAPIVNELEGLGKIQEITNSTHTIELYKHMGGLEQGHNEIALRIKDNTNNQYIKNAIINWTPIMHMTSMSHSCPKSTVSKTETDGTLYEGYLIFQMAQNATEYWDLKIDYIINGNTYTATAVINVPASTKKRVTAFTGSDGVKYIMAYVEPHHPKVALNDLTVALFKMENMMTFSVVDNYKIKIDPRMPSMGNHGSPNNVDLTQSDSDNLYHGKLSLTMTGYWKINLQVLNDSDEILKGEAVSSEVPASSLYFEVEF